MKASIIVTTYNSEGVIETQLQAIASQSGLSDVELIIADNGSTDATADIVARYRDRFPHFRTIDASDARGVSHARNVGAAASTGGYLLFLDHDDEVGEGWLEAVLAALAEYPFVAGRLEHHRLNPDWTIGYRGVESQTTGLEEGDPPFIDYAFGGTLGIRRSLHEAIGGFDEAFTRGAEDCDYCFRVALSGTGLTFVPDAIVHYRYRQEPTAIFRQARGYGRETVKLLVKYSGRGMGRPPARRAIASWLLMVPRLPFELPTQAGRARWILRFGWRLGRLEGSARWHTFAP